MSQTAHFFWQGEISLYEYNCIQSFLLNGFNVNVWAFHNLNIPPGAQIRSASKIINEEKLNSFTMDGREKSLAAFSDYFRLLLLREEGGWWFDTDCICLRPAEEFDILTENSSFLVGLESPDYINNAVIFSTSTIIDAIIKDANEVCVKNNNSFVWGEIGPKLMTSFVNKNNLFKNVLSKEHFYPVHYKEALSVLDPNQILNIEEQTKDSYTLHLWNEVLRKKSINKNEMPPVGSFLHKKFVSLKK
jgi:hypothetical protein